jgi:hypothetical protein
MNQPERLTEQDYQTLAEFFELLAEMEERLGEKGQ